MASSFRTKVEHTVSLMQSVVFKMDASGHPILGQAAIKRKIREGLNELRKVMWYTYVEVPDGHLEDVLADRVDNHPFFDWLDSLRAPRGPVGKKEHGEIWDVFHLLKFFLSRNVNFSKKRGLEYWASDQLPEDLRGDLENIISCETFDQRWEEVLAAVAGGLGPYSTLVKILCGGQPEQRCSGCGDAITITSALLYTGSGPGPSHAERIMNVQLHMNRVIGKAFVISSLHTMFCCHKPDCQNSVPDAAAMRLNRVMAAYMGLAARCKGNRCDNCFLLCRTVHRCSGCFTKAYCSTACRDADRSVHQRFCQTGAPARKVKTGKSGRKEQGAECLDRLAESVADFGLGERQLGVVQDVLQRMA